MAPTSGKKRTSIRAKTSKATPKPSLPLSGAISATASSSAFASSKKDKQAIKHSSFVSKIEKSSKPKKRRRPNKKLVANLESLADALPGVEDDNGAEGEESVVLGQAKIVRRSLKSRPGAMKRKQKLENLEKERFNANLAQMSTGGGIADRWAALKSHVQSTSEKRAEFVGR